MSNSIPLFDQYLIKGVSAADATGIAIFPPHLMNKALETTIYVVFSAASAAGTVLLESSHDQNYSGTWATEATVTWAANTSVKVAHLTAVNKALRVRVSSAVTSGTADIYGICLAAY
jgi:hypothetical protein